LIQKFVSLPCNIANMSGRYALEVTAIGNSDITGHTLQWVNPLREIRMWDNRWYRCAWSAVAEVCTVWVLSHLSNIYRCSWRLWCHRRAALHSFTAVFVSHKFLVTTSVAALKIHSINPTDLGVLDIVW